MNGKGKKKEERRTENPAHLVLAHGQGRGGWREGAAEILLADAAVLGGVVAELGELEAGGVGGGEGEADDL